MALHNDVFNLQIWDFFQNDINSSFEATKRAREGDGKGGQNFTAAMVILTVLDFCAGFYHGKVKPDTDEVTEFIVRYLGNRDRQFSDFDFTKQFYQVFRHGLVHQWSPQFSGIGMNFDRDEILYDVGVLILNVPPFFDLVCKSLKDFENNLDNDEGLQGKFETRLRAITQRDSEAAVKLRELMSRASERT